MSAARYNTEIAMQRRHFGFGVLDRANDNGIRALFPLGSGCGRATAQSGPAADVLNPFHAVGDTDG